MISREQSCLMDLAAFVADATGYHLGRLRFDRHRVREGRYPQHARLNASVLAECEGCVELYIEFGRPVPQHILEPLKLGEMDGEALGV